MYAFGCEKPVLDGEGKELADLCFGIDRYHIYRSRNLDSSENCLLYEYRQVHFMCDGFEFGKRLEPCPICSNETVATVARMFVLYGIIFLFVPAIVFGVPRRARNTTTHDDQLSLGLDIKTNEQNGSHPGIGRDTH